MSQPDQTPKETLKPWRSVAVWPIEAPVPHSDDLHYTEAEAKAVCELLQRNGFGGDGKFFPIHTRVERANPHPAPNTPPSDPARTAAEPIVTAGGLPTHVFPGGIFVRAHECNQAVSALRREVEELRESNTAVREELFLRANQRNEAQAQLAAVTKERDAWRQNEEKARENGRAIAMELRAMTLERDAALASAEAGAKALTEIKALAVKPYGGRVAISMVANNALAAIDAATKGGGQG